MDRASEYENQKAALRKADRGMHGFAVGGASCKSRAFAWAGGRGRSGSSGIASDGHAAERFQPSLHAQLCAQLRAGNHDSESCSRNAVIDRYARAGRGSRAEWRPERRPKHAREQFSVQQFSVQQFTAKRGSTAEWCYATRWHSRSPGSEGHRSCRITSEWGGNCASKAAACAHVPDQYRCGCSSLRRRWSRSGADARDAQPAALMDPLECCKSQNGE
jgi:hypothetical protein